MRRTGGDCASALFAGEGDVAETAEGPPVKDARVEAAGRLREGEEPEGVDGREEELAQETREEAKRSDASQWAASDLHGGTFGESMGAFGPVHLLATPVLSEHAATLEAAVAGGAAEAVLDSRGWVLLFW